jgi:hypothetical protein
VLNFPHIFLARLWILRFVLVCVFTNINKHSQGLKYISVAFANDKIMPKDHSYINNINGNRYINFSEGNQYTPHVGHMGLGNAGNHMTSQGYVRHSGFQQIDSCNTEATVVSATDGNNNKCSQAKIKSLTINNCFLNRRG